MKTYWERRRNNRKEKQIDETEKRPSKKNSQKENKKHPYKKVRK